MRCPYCSNEGNKVIDKRETSDLDITRRRRECLNCSKRFTTYERVEIIDLVIVKKDGRREQFDRSKLQHGVMKACEKVPVKLERIEQLIDEIEIELRKQETTEIKSEDVGELVMDKLKKLNKIAYIRFASIYREFTDIRSFEKEIKKLKT